MNENLLREMESYARQEHVPILSEGGREVFIRTVREKRPQRILEIGTAIGYSALLLLENAADNACLTTLELDEKRADTASLYIERAGYAANVQLCRGDAAEILETLQGPYDLVFIDAAKGQYPDYLRKILPLLADDAVIMADNVLFRGYVRSSEKPPRRYKTIVKRLQAYIQMVEEPAFITEIYEDGDGIAVSKRRIYVEKT